METRRLVSLAIAAAAAAVLASCGGGTIPENLELQVEPTSITFNSVVIHDTATKTVKLWHTGSNGVIKFSAALGSGTSNEFTLIESTVTELQPGDSTFLTVKYTPEDDVKDTGSVVITHNVPPAYQTVVPIQALAAYGDLVVDPNPIDFGQVPAAEKTRDLDVSLINTGSKTITVKEVRLKSPDTDFSILDGSIVTKSGEPLPQPLAYKDTIGLVVRYEPKNGGCDGTYLWVMLDGEDSPREFEVNGCELGPKLVVSPGMVDFGYLKTGESKDVTVTLSNDGNDVLVVTDLSLAEGADADLKVDPTPAASGGPWTIAVGESKDVTVSWKALTWHDPTVPFDNLRVLSNDPYASALLVPVYGTIDVPDINLLPGDVVDFGIVAQLIKTERTLTVRNDGHGTLTVTKIAIDKSKDALDEFAVKADPAFPPTTGGQGTVEGFAATGVNLTFTNKGPASGCVEVPMTIESDSPNESPLTVTLKACRTGKATCQPALMPPTVSFGSVALGDSKTLSVNLVNKGTGNCTFVTARADGCQAGMFGGSTCPKPFAGSPSNAFKVTSVPPTTPAGLGPGMAQPITIEYKPPTVGTLFGVLNQFYALLAVKVLDANVGAGVTPPEIVLPAVPASGTPPANLLGQAGIAKVAVLPGEVKFGLVTIGCWSKTNKICVYSTGNAPLKIKDVTLDGCSPEFKVKDLPGLPKDVNAGVTMCFGVAYAPQDPATDECKVVIETNDQSMPKVAVLLSGEGTYDSDQTDVFIQVSGQAVDVLFVIDDSGSMCSSQDNLIANFDSFIQHANVWNNDYHIGIISVMVTDENVIGKLNRGKPISTRYITPSSQAPQLFKSLADLGCDGGSDQQEAGLEAAQVALTAPLTTDTKKPCNKDSDCTNDPNLCADPAKCPYSCYEGTCGGWNKGFLRDDASLEVIFLADEDDQSSSSLAFYTDFLKNIKGFYNVNMMHAHSIVWQNADCPEPDSSQSEGDRYMKLAQDCGGKVGCICDSSFAQIMDQIGATAFVLKVQFFLTRLADPPTVTVKVDGKTCASGWKYDSNSNSVIFSESGGCMPQPGQKIEIHYKTLCLTE